MNMISDSQRGLFPRQEASDAVWFLRPHVRQITPAPGAVRLFCFPCAGHGAAMYRSWQAALGADVDLWPVQPPGRGTRLREAAFDSVPELVEALLPALFPLLDRPYAFFGHSYGATVAAFTALAVAEAGARAPSCLFLSSRHPPDVPSPVPPLSHLDDAAFVEEVHARYDAIPAEIMAESDLLAMLLPALRADIRALEALNGSAPRPLPAPVITFGGDADRLVPARLLDGWQGWAPLGYRRKLLAGGHFYLDAQRRVLMDEIRATLSGVQRGGRR